jgi:hypothetical protein
MPVSNPPRGRPPARLHWQAVENILARGRHLARVGKITAKAYLVLAVITKDCRQSGTNKAVAAYARLRRLTRSCNATVVEAIRLLIGAGLLQKEKTAVRALWVNGGERWVQMPNIYWLIEPRRNCESGGQPDLLNYHSIFLTKPPGEAIAARKLVAERQWRTLIGDAVKRIEEKEGEALAARAIRAMPA